MKKQVLCILVYNFSQHIFEADDELAGEYRARVIPMPTEIGNPCNHALVLEEEPLEAYRRLVSHASPIAGVYLLMREGIKAKARLLTGGEITKELAKL